MSDYQQRKVKAVELQREKEELLKRELDRKIATEKQKARDDEEKRLQREAAAKEARRLELSQANDALNNDKNTKGDRAQWDPFAEDEQDPASKLADRTSVISKLKATHGARSLTSSPRAGPSTARSTYSSTKPTSRTREVTPPTFESRKERAARLFAQQAKRDAGSDSLFSVRSMVDANGTSLPRPVSNGKNRNPPVRSMSSTQLPGMKGQFGMSAGKMKDELRRQASSGGLRQLQSDKRDTRGPEEAQRDIKARKAVEAGLADIKPKGEGAKIASPIPTATKMAKPKLKPTPAPIPSTARPVNPTQSTPRSPKRRRQSSSPSSSPPPPKKIRERAEIDDGFDYSAEIRAMFRRPGRPVERYAESEDESDMEAGLSDVEMEEKRTAKIARKEDAEAERDEMERKAAKEKLKKAREKIKAS